MCTLCFVSDLKTHVARDLPVSELRKPSCQEHRPFLLILKHSYEKKGYKVFNIHLFFFTVVGKLKGQGQKQHNVCPFDFILILPKLDS